MLRTLFATIGVVELLRPAALVAAAERLAAERPGACELRSSTLPMVRLEGLVFLVIAARRDADYSGPKKLLGLVGVLSLLFPRQFLDAATGIAYTGDCTWRPWVYTATRVVGLLYVLVGFREWRSKSD